jgi:hypothetical protein
VPYKKGDVTRFRPHPGRFVLVAVIIAVASAGILWATTYRSLTEAGRVELYGFAPPAPAGTQFYASPTWAVPVAALIGIAAIGAATFVLRRR